MSYTQIVRVIERASRDHRGLQGKAFTREEVLKLALILDVAGAEAIAADLDESERDEGASKIARRPWAALSFDDRGSVA